MEISSFDHAGFEGGEVLYLYNLYKHDADADISQNFNSFSNSGPNLSLGRPTKSSSKNSNPGKNLNMSQSTPKHPD